MTVSPTVARIVGLERTGSSGAGRLVLMGYSPALAALALRSTGNNGLQPALDWILSHPDGEAAAAAGSAGSLATSSGSGHARAGAVSAARLFGTAATHGQQPEPEPAAGEATECAICFDALDVKSGQMSPPPCGHQFCSTCLEGYFKFQISEGDFLITCAMDGCDRQVGYSHWRDCHSAAPPLYL